MLIDSHCHLTHGRLAARAGQLMDEARAAGVVAVVTAASDVADATAALGLARRHEGVYCSAGVHPHEAAKVPGTWLDQLRSIIGAGRGADGGVDLCVAVGEIGLDYHYDFSPRDDQRRVFEAQLELAAELGKPIIVHSREATADALAALAPYAGRLQGVIHSFTGDSDEVTGFLDQGWHIGFAGIVTFNRSDANRAAAARVPAERLLVETDAPYLSPVPVRKVFPNVPAHVTHTAKLLAEVRRERFEDLARRTTTNAAELFGIGLQGDSAGS